MRILHVIPGLTHERGGPSVAMEAFTRLQTLAGGAPVALAYLLFQRRVTEAITLSAGIKG